MFNKIVIKNELSLMKKIWLKMLGDKSKLKLFLNANELYNVKTYYQKTKTNGIETISITFYKKGVIEDKRLLELKTPLQATYNAPVTEIINKYEKVVYKILKHYEREEYNLYDKGQKKETYFLKLDRLNTLNLENSRHLTIAGYSGGGKSATLKHILRELSKMTRVDILNAIVIDGKNTELSQFALNLGVSPTNISKDLGDPLKLLKKATAEMEKRFNLVQQGKAKEKDFKILPVVIDELLFINQYYSTNKEKHKEFISLLTQLLVRSRSVGFMIITTTQKPTQKAYGSEFIRDNHTYKIWIGSASRVDLNTFFNGDVADVDNVYYEVGTGLISKNGSTPSSYMGVKINA